MQRRIVKMSQEDLATALGVTFQQVQKYEKGSNRIGAGRLFEIAKILGVSIQFFFEGLNTMEETSAPLGANADESQTEGGLRAFLSSREAVELNRVFTGIECAQSRRAVLTLVRTLGDLSDRQD